MLLGSLGEIQRRDGLDRGPRQNSLLTISAQSADNTLSMKQNYHTIIKPESNGWFVGWAEEIPGTITYGRSLDECRRNLRDALAAHGGDPSG